MQYTTHPAVDAVFSTLTVQSVPPGHALLRFPTHATLMGMMHALNSKLVSKQLYASTFSVWRAVREEPFLWVAVVCVR